MAHKKLSIAILGTRGIPNRYGGFEACAEQLGLYLCSSGHDVSVYCGSDHPVKEAEWKGIRRIMIKNPEDQWGSFGQFFYDLNCNLHSRKQAFDIVLHLGYTSDSVWHFLWAKRSIHVVNMDGLEWKRQKYGRLTKRFLKYAEDLAGRHANSLVADNPEIERLLKLKFRNPIRMIPYGAVIPASLSGDHVSAIGLRSGQYDLVVARMEPENNVVEAIEAKLESNDSIPLAIIGNENHYKAQLQKRYANVPGIIFLDPVYDPARLNSIRHYSRYYIHGHSVGGTNPSLLEAMACQCNIIAHDNAFNRSVLEGHALFFADKDELKQVLSEQPGAEFVNWKENNMNKIRNKYNWELVSAAYEEVFRDAIDHT